ncbi:MAG TPA: hypothetical protein VIS78_02965, partial [Blastocatellia bacterium]
RGAQPGDAAADDNKISLFGHWSFVPGHLSLVIGYCSLIIVTPQPASAGLPTGPIGQPFYGWFTAMHKPIARFNGLTPSGFSLLQSCGSSREEKDAKAPFVI